MTTAEQSFNLTIRLGNDAMQSAEDIAQALIVLGERMASRGWEAPGNVKDGNGNTVGSWRVRF